MPVTDEVGTDCSPAYNLPFEFLVAGEYTEEQLLVALVPNSMRWNSETKRLIDAEWESVRTWAAGLGRRPRSSGLCRLSAWGTSGGTLHLVLGRTEFKELVGTNYRHPELMAIYGESFLANSLGVSSVVVTEDGWLLVQRRSDRVGAYPGAYHVCGGHLERPKRRPTKEVRPFAAMQRELWQELKIKPHTLAEMRCLGLVRDLATHKPELVFAARVALPESRFSKGVGEEHEELIAIRDDPVVLADFLAYEKSRFVPVGLGCLMAYGNSRFGREWRETVNEQIRRQ